MISLDYNTTYVLRFNAVNSSVFWIFNVHTLLITEYTPDAILVTLELALAGLFSRWIQTTLAGLIALITIRALRFPSVDLKDEKSREPKGKPTTEDGIEGFSIDAPVTGWEIFWRLRLWLLLVLAVVVFWLSPVSMNPDWQYPFYTWAVVSAGGWWLFNQRYGFTLDARELSKGWVELNEITKDQMDLLTTEAHVVGSPLGPVALVGHLLYSREKAHTQLELITNTLLIEDIASFQLKVMPEYLKFKRTLDTAVAKGYNEEVVEWMKLMKIRTGDENSSTE